MHLQDTCSARSYFFRPPSSSMQSSLTVWLEGDFSCMELTGWSGLGWQVYSTRQLFFKVSGNHRLSETERISWILDHGSWVIERMFPKVAKCDWYRVSIAGQIDVCAIPKCSCIPLKYVTVQNMDFMCVLSYNYIYEKLCLVSIIET